MTKAEFCGLRVGDVIASPTGVRCTVVDASSSATLIIARPETPTEDGRRELFTVPAWQRYMFDLSVAAASV